MVQKRKLYPGQPRKSLPPRRKKEPSEAVKAAADRAEARSRGEEQDKPAVPIDPAIDHMEPDDEPIEKRGKGGRTPDYEPWMCQVAQKLCERGATDDEIAQELDVSTRTLYRWKGKYEEFCQAIITGKSIADERVERSMYALACGSYYVEKQAIKVKVDRYTEKVEIVEVERYRPPDPGSASFWLKNRRKETWKDTKNVETRALDDDGETGEVEAARKVAFMLGRAVGRAEKTETTEKHVDAEPDSAA